MMLGFRVEEECVCPSGCRVPDPDGRSPLPCAFPCSESVGAHASEHRSVQQRIGVLYRLGSSRARDGFCSVMAHSAVKALSRRRRRPDRKMQKLRDNVRRECPILVARDGCDRRGSALIFVGPDLSRGGAEAETEVVFLPATSFGSRGCATPHAPVIAHGLGDATVPLMGPLQSRIARAMVPTSGRPQRPPE